MTIIKRTATSAAKKETTTYFRKLFSENKRLSERKVAVTTQRGAKALSFSHAQKKRHEEDNSRNHYSRSKARYKIFFKTLS